jgi:hypothetical protein
VQSERDEAKQVQGGQHATSWPALALEKAEDQRRDDRAEAEQRSRGAGAARTEHALSEIHRHEPGRVDDGSGFRVC